MSGFTYKELIESKLGVRASFEEARAFFIDLLMSCEAETRGKFSPRTRDFDQLMAEEMRAISLRILHALLNVYLFEPGQRLMHFLNLYVAFSSVLPRGFEFKDSHLTRVLQSSAFNYLDKMQFLILTMMLPPIAKFKNFSHEENLKSFIARLEALLVLSDSKSLGKIGRGLIITAAFRYFLFSDSRYSVSWREKCKLFFDLFRHEDYSHFFDASFNLWLKLNLNFKDECQIGREVFSSYVLEGQAYEDIRQAYLLRQNPFPDLIAKPAEEVVAKPLEMEGHKASRRYSDLSVSSASVASAFSVRSRRQSIESPADIEGVAEDFVGLKNFASADALTESLQLSAALPVPTVSKPVVVATPARTSVVWTDALTFGPFLGLKLAIVNGSFVREEPKI